MLTLHILRYIDNINERFYL